MPFVLKFDMETKTSRTLKCTVRGYLNNQKAICVVTQHERTGDLPLASDDPYWVHLVEQCTNDTSMEFGKVLEYEDYIWIENKPSKDGQGESFELVTFDIVQVTKHSQKLINPTRQAISHVRVSELIGEQWNTSLEPTSSSFAYWHPRKTTVEPPPVTPRSIAEGWIDEVQNDKYFGLIYIDIDLFKLHNDCCGHVRGDQTLEQVSAFLQQRLIVGSYRWIRIGGDEFVIVVGEANALSTFALAESIRTDFESLALPLRDDTQPDYAQFTHYPEILTISLSALIFGKIVRTNGFALLRLAEACVDFAKSVGRNRTISIDLRQNEMA